LPTPESPATNAIHGCPSAASASAASSSASSAERPTKVELQTRVATNQVSRVASWTADGGVMLQASASSARATSGARREIAAVTP
jgi:hypothetical protein